MLEVNGGGSNYIPLDEARPPEPVSEQRTEHDPDCYFDSDEDPVPLPDGQKHCGCIIWFPEATNICCLRKDIRTDPNDHHVVLDLSKGLQSLHHPFIDQKKVRYDHIK